MNKTGKYLLFLITWALFTIMNSPAITAGDISDMTREDYEKVLWGGLLYDNWNSVLGIKPGGSHPSYPAEGKKQGRISWRCKECHGWDYQGKDGAYATGSHFTGIKGIRQSADKDPEMIEAVLKDDTHSFGSTISEEAYKALALFVVHGQIDMDRHIERSTKKARGNRSSGAKIYTSTCAKCHGMDGRKINFKTPDKPEYIGTLANKNPWEALHKIRFGQPGTQMVNLLFLNISDQVDVLSFCQSLPVK